MNSESSSAKQPGFKQNMLIFLYNQQKTHILKVLSIDHFQFMLDILC